ncbi:hypothetical protein BDV59DRAFT_183178 [Aspergillus ambiguus]|uniref:uncharacterized protein n=1 Tax=Aspergillus ambiguus TaxID=176160 RepID=UPI003CCE43C7
MKFSTVFATALLHAPLLCSAWELVADQTYSGSGLNDCTNLNNVLPPDYPLHVDVEPAFTMILFSDPNCQGPSTPAAGPAEDLPIQSRWQVSSFKVTWVRGASIFEPT